MAELEFVRTYQDDLIIGNSTFDDHLHQLEVKQYSTYSPQLP